MINSENTISDFGARTESGWGSQCVSDCQIISDCQYGGRGRGLCWCDQKQAQSKLMQIYILHWGQRERRYRRWVQFSDPCSSSWNPWGFRETVATPSSHRLCSCLACSCDLHYMGPCINIIRQLWQCHLIYALIVVITKGQISLDSLQSLRVHVSKLSPRLRESFLV